MPRMAERGGHELAEAGSAASWDAAGFDFPQVLAIADALPMGLAFLSPDHRYRFVNRALADFFERPRRDLIGLTMEEVMGAKAAALRMPMFEAALGGERRWFSADFPHPSRGTLAIQSEYLPQLAPDGTVIGIIILTNDVTEQRVAEEALKESELRFRRIANSAPVMMWVTRLDRTRDFANDAYAGFFGLSSEEARKRDWLEFVHPDDRAQILADIEIGPIDGQMVEVEARYRRHDGEWRWLRSVSQPRYGPENQLIGYIGVATDVTVAKQAEGDLRQQVEERTRELAESEAQLRQAQKMEALGQLTGGIAHDFNNLLTVVVGGLDLIAKQVEDERLKRYAGNALKAAERGARLTAQLLAFSRVQRLEVEPMNVRDHLEEMRPLLRNVLGPGIEKKMDLSDEPMAVMADATQLEVAVLNLVINARDAMPDGGTLTISTHNRTIVDDPELDDGHYVEVAISDTGTGMPPDIVARVFEPFFTTKEVGKGTGLGLSMVYGMARQSGGTARIRSEEGVGTTVSLFFRHADEDVFDLSDRLAADGSEMEQVTHKILIVDDDEDVRCFVACSLEEFGHSVSEAKDGPSALAAFDKNRPDLVILDYVMPGMTGAEVAIELRKRVPGQPLLFVTGYSESQAIRDAAPDASVITKPFRPETLDLAVRDAMTVRKESGG